MPGCRSTTIFWSARHQSFAIGKKGWLFSDTTDGPNASVIISGLMFTCLACGAEPLDHILNELPQRRTIRMTLSLSLSLALPCGATLRNRIAKAAMSEGLTDERNRASEKLEQTYKRWSVSGAALLISGNVQVDRLHLEHVANLVIDNSSDRESLERLAKADTAGGSHFWLQLSHTPRQVDSAINKAPLAPSTVEIELFRGANYSFAPPVAMSEAQLTTRLQFVSAAKQAQEAGFTGVQFHAAHGYLISQFLSPRTNIRTDRFGGSLENRARLLLEMFMETRKAVGPSFPISVKLKFTRLR